jgi:hypothetical protein
VYVKHNRSQTPEYKCWQQIKARCLNPAHRAYPNYGGRGIGMHLAWVDDFEAFYAYVGPRPSSQHSLDRYPNNNGGYEPGNVRWATPEQQNRNRRPHRAHGTWAPRARSERVTNFKHGLIHTPEYRAWGAMKTRCLNPNYPDYPNWGGRGITVYEPWITDFMAFYQYMGQRPSPTHSIDRYPNPNGNYEPGNVRWATKQEQSENRRPTTTGPDHGNYEHGAAQKGNRSPEYKTWSSIKTRCFNATHDRYSDYGGAGITMCAGWRGSFPAFLSSVGPKPTPQHTLGRKDLAGHYSCGVCPECVLHGWPVNCVWATKTEQNRARRPSTRSGKLTVEKAQAIRDRLATGATQKEVAVEFDVGRTLVGKIGRGEVWV